MHQGWLSFARPAFHLVQSFVKETFTSDHFFPGTVLQRLNANPLFFEKPLRTFPRGVGAIDCRQRLGNFCSPRREAEVWNTALWSDCACFSERRG